MTGLIIDDAWLDALAAATGDLPERPGATATMGFTVSGLPEVVSFVVEMVDGAVTAVTAVERPGDEVDFVFLLGADRLTDVLAGDNTLEVGYMRGEIKVTGDIGRMLSVLPVTTSPQWRTALASVAPEPTA